MRRGPVSARADASNVCDTDDTWAPMGEQALHRTLRELQEQSIRTAAEDSPARTRRRVSQI